MTITEAARHHLVSRAQEVLGTEAGMTLAEHLPPVGWADVATRQDLEAWEARMDLRFTSHMDLRFKSLDERFRSVDEQFNAVDEQFNAVDERFQSVDKQLKAIDEQFRAVHERFRSLDAKFGSVDAQFKAVHEQFGSVAAQFRHLEDGLDHRFAAQDFKMEALEHRLLGAIYQSATAQTRTFIVALISTLIAFSGVGLAAAQLAAR